MDVNMHIVAIYDVKIAVLARRTRVHYVLNLFMRLTLLTTM